jgi:hypothetical protein
MAKSVPLSADELDAPPVNHSAGAISPRGAARRRASVPSAQLVPMQFRMPPEFAREFRVAATSRNMKYNELLKECFDAFIKSSDS